MATLPEVGTARTGSTSSGALGSSTGSTTDQAKDKAHEAAASVKDQASDLKDKAAARAEDALSDQKEMAANQLGGITDALHQTTQSLRDNGQEPVANAVDQVAGQVERLNNYLQNRTVSDLLSDAERFARREPGLFLGAAALIGIAAGRFVRASRPTPDYDSYGGYTGGGYTRRSVYSDPSYRDPGYQGGYDPQTGAYAAPLTGAPTAGSRTGDRAMTGTYSGGTYDADETQRATLITNDPTRNA
jgi:hypothetical protein